MNTGLCRGTKGEDLQSHESSNIVYIDQANNGIQNWLIGWLMIDEGDKWWW